MFKAFLGIRSYILLIAVILVGIAGCDNPGSVGSELGRTKAAVSVDTFAISNVNSYPSDYYSGGFSYFSLGKYNDPLFGTVEATGLIKPALPISVENTVSDDAKMFMRLFFEDDNEYGDAEASQKFDIYEIDEIWRSNAVKLHDNLDLKDSNGPLGSFTATNGDSLDVEIPSEWVQKYREYVNNSADSLYEIEQFGLALVPSDSNKIIAPIADSTRFVIKNSIVDSFKVGATDAAYLLNRRSDGSVPDNSVAWHSTIENLVEFDLDMQQIDVDPSDISKAELIFYRNNDLLESSLSSEPSSVSRLEETTAYLYLINPNDLPANITPGNPVAQGSYSSDDEGYHFPFTNQLQNLITQDIPEGNVFMMTLSNNGMIKSTVIYTDKASYSKQPKIIITSLKNSSN